MAEQKTTNYEPVNQQKDIYMTPNQNYTGPKKLDFKDLAGLDKLVEKNQNLASEYKQQKGQ